MPKPHAPNPPYPAQFRQLLIKLVQTGRNPNELTREFGCHVTSIEFGNRCAQMGIRPLKGSAGDAYADLGFCHNDLAGSLFATLECELIDRRVWETQTQTRLAVFTSIEG